MKIFRFILTFFIVVLAIFSTAFAIETNCPNIILIEESTGRTLYEKEAYAHVPPASTTKVMTAILALEHCKLNEMATASYGAIMSVPLDGSNTAIQVGEKISVANLLRCLLIASRK